MRKFKELIKKSLFFPIAMWLLSRLVIVIAMLLIAPLLPAPQNGIAATFSWNVFSAWDSIWYQIIATFGYGYTNEYGQSAVAFFPLFPLLIHLIMSFGLPFEVAGVLLNNLAFLAALIVLYLWVEENYGTHAARWATATLAWCPYSVYGTVIYTEGLFLLFTTAALRAFDKQQYLSVAFWGALSTAVRSPGIALIPAFLFVSWKERRGVKAYLASLAVGLGVLVYSLYCQIKFSDALAFVHAQKGWRSSAGFDWQGWWYNLMLVVIGPVNAQSGHIQDPLHPLLFTFSIVSGCLLWYFRSKLSSPKLIFGFYLLNLILWLLGGDPYIKILLVFGGIYFLWLSRNKIPLAAVVYGFCSFLLILNIGNTLSVERYAYGIVSLSVGFGLLLARYPRWGYAIMSFFAILIATFAIRFSQDLWLA
ncbi:mannosyltransferase family protein [Nostoc sp. 106C]|uniref:mannosyltransferase family protein n=1 Tax=Nostoc sp. 106C TaxID=1932667 RepID=UPI000A374954|nr:mannosyltransferase family protein [Nostoc sp. 106C]OUL26315.1 hypothetical protein BV375_21765 [Nostoc sp. 106C]